MRRKKKAPEKLREEQHRRTLEALADVDAGRVIEHRVVRAWADSLDTRKPDPLSSFRRRGSG